MTVHAMVDSYAKWTNATVHTGTPTHSAMPCISSVGDEMCVREREREIRSDAGRALGMVTCGEKMRTEREHDMSAMFCFFIYVWIRLRMSDSF